MAAHPFPPPPDLSELLKFFGSPIDLPAVSTSQQQQQPSNWHRHGARKRSDGRASSSRHTIQRKQTSASRSSAAMVAAVTEKATQPQYQRRHESPPKEPTPRAHDWNGSTQIPTTIAKPLKHQILNRSYQPPAPVIVDASGATHLLQRLSKTTVSSRLKRHQSDQAATLAAATAVLAGAFERRNKCHVPHQRSAAQLTDELSRDDDEYHDASRVSPDSRARDAIQMLLMYRKEVEKRLSMDPTHFPSQ